MTCARCWKRPARSFQKPTPRRISLSWKCDGRNSTASVSERGSGVGRLPGASLANARGTVSPPQCSVNLSMSQAILEDLQKTYIEKQAAIRARLAEFEAILLKGDDERLFEELVFCIF